MFRLALLGLLLAGLLVLPGTAQAQTQTCQFVLGFRTLHDLISDHAGDCRDNQGYAVNGDAQQLTTKGLMVWRKADNWTAFTDGYQTWLMGPYGLVERLNTQRYPWEPDYGMSSLTPAPSELLPPDQVAADRAAAVALFQTQMAALGAGDGEAYGRTLAGHIDGPWDLALIQTLLAAGIKYKLDDEQLISLDDGRAVVQTTVTTTGTASGFRNSRTVTNHTAIHEGGGWKDLTSLVMKVEYI
jgi:hypothetical protein